MGGLGSGVFGDSGLGTKGFEWAVRVVSSCLGPGLRDLQGAKSKGTRQLPASALRPFT